MLNSRSKPIYIQHVSYVNFAFTCTLTVSWYYFISKTSGGVTAYYRPTDTCCLSLSADVGITIEFACLLYIQYPDDSSRGQSKWTITLRWRCHMLSFMYVFIPQAQNRRLCINMCKWTAEWQTLFLTLMEVHSVLYFDLTCATLGLLLPGVIFDRHVMCVVILLAAKKQPIFHVWSRYSWTFVWLHS